MKPNLATLFPYEERQAILRKANIMFKKDMDFVLKYWKRHSNPLRGSIIRAYNKYVLVSHTDPRIVHVSDIAKMLFYDDVSRVSIVDEITVRVLARGIFYHELFRKRFGDRVKATFEYPMAWYVKPLILVGNVDMIIDSGDGFYVVELKSTSTENTINYGIVQVKIYWGMLEHFYNVNVQGAFVSTPKQDIEVTEPVTKRELRRLVEAYANRRFGGLLSPDDLEEYFYSRPY